MTIEYNLRKNYRNDWEARSVQRISAPDSEGKYKRLEIVTSKRSDGCLVTNASVSTVDSNRGFVTHMVFQDFTKRLLVTATRCTEKAVRAQHEKALAEHLDDVRRSALLAYGLIELAA